ncbi:MAG: ferrous iron transport protein A [Deltaproteobacteria bacterium]|nr:ferrous iron transport protein A [Deltaproteobacteria bacterium]
MTVLGDLSPGDRARVQSVRCAPAVRRRLLEMGLLPGTELAVVRRAPLGDPIEVRLRGYSLSLRKSEASGITVTLVAQPSSDHAHASAPLPAE